jgi:hypothetical protein
MAQPTVVIGIGAIIILLLFGLLAAVVLTALLIWILPFAIILYGIYLLSQNKTTAGMVAVVAGAAILVFATVF